MTDLVVRRLLIDLETPFPGRWNGGDAFRSAFFNALSMSFPAGEQYFIDAVRAGLKKLPCMVKNTIKPQYDEWVFPDGHSVLILAEGRLLNLGCATGHPSFVMSASFTNQVLAQLELHENAEKIGIQVLMLPKKLDEEVARLHLEKLGVRLTRLSDEQAKYISVSPDGPYKPEHYRY